MQPNGGRYWRLKYRFLGKKKRQQARPNHASVLATDPVHPGRASQIRQQPTDLRPQPTTPPQIATGHYQLIRKGELVKQAQIENTRIYRLTHPLGEYVFDQGRNAPAPTATLRFSYAQWLEGRNPRISVIEQLVDQQGWLQLNLLELDSFQREEHLVFTAMADSGELLDQETCEKLFQLCASAEPTNVRRVPGSQLANDRTGEIIYTPPEGEDRLRDMLANWARFLHNETELDPLVRNNAPESNASPENSRVCGCSSAIKNRLRKSGPRLWSPARFRNVARMRECTSSLL